MDYPLNDGIIFDADGCKAVLLTNQSKHAALRIQIG